MGQMLNDAAVKVAQIMLRCAIDMGHITSQTMITAFGSEVEQTTAARSEPNEHETGIARGVPGEVAILCEEIFEV